MKQLKEEFGSFSYVLITIFGLCLFAAEAAFIWGVMSIIYLVFKVPVAFTYPQALVIATVIWIYRLLVSIGEQAIDNEKKN